LVETKLHEIIKWRLSSLLVEAVGDKIIPGMEVEITGFNLSASSTVSEGMFVVKESTPKGSIMAYRGSVRKRVAVISSPTVIRLLSA
jgi:hypothetical protein